MSTFTSPYVRTFYMSTLSTLDALAIEPADPSSPIPLYYQVESHLREAITSGTIPVGATLPSEMELSARFSVSRHTMRMALSRLVAENLIARRAGRGTVVNLPPDKTRFYLDRSFTRQMQDMGRTAHSECLEQRTSTITPDAPDILLSQQGIPCLHLTRLRFGDDEPISLQYTTLLTQHCPNIERIDFAEASLYDVLAREYQLVITQIDHTIGATLADAEQAQALLIDMGDPLLVVETTAYSESQLILEHTISYYRADRYSYRTTHTFVS